jgi:hypothetical protein
MGLYSWFLPAFQGALIIIQIGSLFIGFAREPASRRVWFVGSSTACGLYLIISGSERLLREPSPLHLAIVILGSFGLGASLAVLLGAYEKRRTAPEEGAIHAN